MKKVNTINKSLLGHFGNSCRNKYVNYNSKLILKGKIINQHQRGNIINTQINNNNVSFRKYGTCFTILNINKKEQKMISQSPILCDFLKNNIIRYIIIIIPT
uniref:Uncharacterized protein n=1 Tax=Cacopsylla melanoneura TaxID=428564 RepID=A0A8D8ZVP8_9HEMI